jgi:hypothetical protein
MDDGWSRLDQDRRYCGSYGIFRRSGLRVDVIISAEWEGTENRTWNLRDGRCRLLGGNKRGERDEKQGNVTKHEIETDRN